MPLETAVALTGFAFVMTISPGPSNFLLLASGANFGFLRSVPLVLGVSTGFLSIVFLIGVGLGQLLEQLPVAYTMLRLVCGAYVLWLAFTIARSRGIGPGTRDDIAAPVGFVQAALLQLVNPKAWAVALIVTVTYTDPARFLVSLLTLIAIFGVVSLPALSTWALFGAALRRTLAEGRRIVMFNVSMALLLVASMVPVLLDLR